MAFYINTNIASLQAQNYLNKTQNYQSQTIQEVTSGLRIVNSGNDAAGLAIANGYRSDEAVLTQGIQNANDGLSQLQIADGGISNISQLLDRARTLATESASGTFTGNRGVLNSEFQSVIGEINRQAQAIGLNQGGTFAKTLTTFIGGGTTSNGVSATANGTISLNLGNSTVDATSLGLSGVQAAGVSGSDIGPGASATSLANILSNATNSGSVSTPGYTTFIVKGPGFGNGVSLSVNTANLGSTSDLVGAINSAISAASHNGTQQGTALLNANISAAINTDANGRQQLAFNSSNAAFQVQAGDQLSNALLGNFAQNASVTGTDANATVTLGSTQTLGVTFDGAASPVNVSFAAGTYSKADIVKALNSNTGFSAAGTASLQGNQIVIASKANSASSSVAVTASTFANTTLGLSSTTATAAAASTGASLNTQVTAANNTALGTATFGTAGAGTITFQFQGAGLTSPATVSITTTAAETVTQAITALNTAVAGNSALKSAGISLTTATAGNALTFTSNSGQQFAVGVTGDTQNLLGFGSFVAGANGAYDYNTLTAGTSYNNATAVGTSNFEISLGGGVSASTIAVDLTGGDATAATATSTDSSAAPLAVTANNNTLNLSINGTSYSVSLNVGGSVTKSDIANQINAAITAQGTATVNSNNQLVITSKTLGAGGSVQIQSGSANTLLGLAAGAPSTGTSRSGLSVAAALNSAFAANSTYQAAGLQASFSGGKITVASSNNTYFRLNAFGSAAAAKVVGNAQQGTAATAATTTGTTTTATIVAGTNDDFNIAINGGTAQHIFLAGGGGSQTTAQIAAELNSNPLLNGVTASVDSSNHLVFTSNAVGAGPTSRIVLSAGTNSALGALGLTAGTYNGTASAAGFNIGATNNKISVTVDGGTAQVITLSSGANQTTANIVSDLNTYFTANSIGATASSNNGTLQVVSNSTGANSSVVFNTITNSAYATLGLTAGTTYSGTTADAGFGATGVTFGGNVQTAAPSTSPAIDAGGSSQTNALSFTPILTGSGQQTVTIAAQDANGAQQSLAVNLSNNATSRNGQSIDQAIDAINTSLQQSNNSTLKQIVAVKDDVAGAAKIRFVSTLNSFQVSIGTTAQGTGIGSQGTTQTSSVSTGGSTAEINDISGANAAVNALAQAVTALGNAQAVIGRGENQFHYAINLAQSQLTNVTSAESTIRDADLAAESANLTKSQIQLQAGIAALAQANSAPQQILKLLQ